MGALRTASALASLLHFHDFNLLPPLLRMHATTSIINMPDPPGVHRSCDAPYHAVWRCGYAAVHLCCYAHLRVLRTSAAQLTACNSWMLICCCAMLCRAVLCLYLGSWIG